MEPRHRPVRRHRWRGWAVVVVLGVVAGLGATQVWHHLAPRRQPPAPAPVAATSGPQGSALAVLREWDRRRAQAWASGEPALLRTLYTPHSRAGRADLALQQRYRDRGLVVLGMRRQLVDARVDEHTADRLTVVVTDRLVGAWAAPGPGADGSRRTRLPASAVATRTIVLVHVAGTWKVQEVTPR